MPVSAAKPRFPLDDVLRPMQGGSAVTLRARHAAIWEVVTRPGQMAPTMGRSAALWGGQALWIGPSRALLLDGAPPDDAVAVIDQSGGFAILCLGGPSAREVLARICRVDLHPAAFPTGSVARSVMAQVPVVLHLGADGFDLLIPTTLARALARHLLHIAAGFGCSVLPSIPERVSS